ncbi:MAG: hypothetical protein HY302_08555 [Opitutae bacterium]|nr:hypothetical protein [Opitutae bacterium]
METIVRVARSAGLLMLASCAAQPPAPRGGPAPDLAAERPGPRPPPRAGTAGPGELVLQIGRCPPEDRAALLAVLRNQREELRIIRQKIDRPGGAMSPDERARWLIHLPDLERRGAELDRCIEEARAGTAEDWLALRPRLAALYAEYANARILAESSRPAGK